MQALVVDDSMTARILLCHVLRDLGFDVEEAPGGGAALLALAQQEPPDLILLDWNMPDLSGLEVLQAIRKAPQWSGCRVLMVTSETEAPMVSWALEEGADEYVMKPISPAMIRDKLMLVGLLPSA
ncbi:MAG TPA: response regulator [bacterium]|jgi:two-component system chemotaxis response regulator CheY|nr:response regulator [bacterium]